MKFFYLLYFANFQLFTLNNNKIFVGEFLSTLGIKLNIYIENNKSYITQTNIKGEEIAKFTFYNDFKKNIFTIYKQQNTEGINLFHKVAVTSFNASEVKFKQIHNINENNKKETNNLSTINLYGFLKVINSLKIFDGYKPDYNRISMETKEESTVRKFHELYYRLNGLNNKHTEHSYINDSRTYTMGNILGLFGNPFYVFFSGKGEEIFLYIGVHKCNKPLISFMIIQFDLYGKVMKYFHHIPLCDCHKNKYSIKEILVMENTDKY
jgi:hypothetical protein